MNVDDFTACIDAARRGDASAIAALPWVSYAYTQSIIAQPAEPQPLDNHLAELFTGATFKMDFWEKDNCLTGRIIYAGDAPEGDVVRAIEEWSRKTNNPTDITVIQDGTA